MYAGFKQAETVSLMVFHWKVKKAYMRKRVINGEGVTRKSDLKLQAVFDAFCITMNKNIKTKEMSNAECLGFFVRTNQTIG